MRGSWSWILLSILFVACVDRRHLVANSPDYELYRQSRVAPTLEARLNAGWRYLQQYPVGEFRRDVQKWFKPAEADYYEYARPSRARLRRYLAALPDGPHAPQARLRLEELNEAERAQKRKEERVMARVRAVNEKLEAAEAARKSFVRTTSDWVRRLALLKGFGLPTNELDHEFDQAYRVESPAAACEEDRCVKQMTMSYSIPEGGKLSERIAVFDIILTLEQGSVVRAELTGPELFSRLGEAVQRVPVPVDDGQRRAEAIGAAEQLVSTMLASHLPPEHCAVLPVSPTVLERRCHGILLRMIAAVDMGGEDRIVVEPDAADANTDSGETEQH